MGSTFNSAGANLATRVALHGGLSSFMSKAQGGRWSSGFWSGAVGTYLGHATSGVKGYYQNVAKNAIIGGTISHITGGKFANGAALGAFRYMFNEWAHRAKDEYGQPNYNVSEKMKLTSKYSPGLNIDDSKRIYGKDGSWYQRYRTDGTAMESWAGQVHFQYYNGHSPSERFIYGTGEFAQVMIRDHGDGLGLTLSVGAVVTTGGLSYFLGVSAIGIDILQQDPYGVGIGIVAMSEYKSTAVIDIAYGTYQLFK